MSHDEKVIIHIIPSSPVYHGTGNHGRDRQIRHGTRADSHNGRCRSPPSSATDERFTTEPVSQRSSFFEQPRATSDRDERAAPENALPPVRTVHAEGAQYSLHDIGNSISHSLFKMLFSSYTGRPLGLRFAKNNYLIVHIVGFSRGMAGYSR